MLAKARFIGRFFLNDCYLTAYVWLVTIDYTTLINITYFTTVYK